MTVPSHIPIEEICQKILKRNVLDIFYLIMQERELSKADIAQLYKKYEDNPDAKLSKYRSHIEIGIAYLEGAQFISSWRDGQADRYFLTNYGEVAVKLVAKLLDEDLDGTMLLGSKVVSKIMKELNNKTEE